MPTKKMERDAAPALAQRLQAAAEMPTPIKFKDAAPPPPAYLFPTPAEAPAPATLLERVLGERYGSGGGERRMADRLAAAERHAQASAALDEGAAAAGGRFDDAPSGAAFTLTAETPLLAPETAQEGPPTLPLPQEVADGLARPPAPAQGLPPKGPGWAGLDAPFEPADPYREACLDLLHALVDRDGEGAITEAVAWRIRRAAHVLLYGREAGRPA